MKYDLIDLDEIVARLATKLKDLAVHRGVELIYQGCKAATVKASPHLIAWVVFKIGFNAIINTARDKASTEKVVQITVQCTGDEVRVIISDCGNGLSDADLERMFDRKYQSSEENFAHYNGQQMETYRKNIEMSGGRLWAEHRMGGGTTFQFTLPTQESAQIGSSIVRECDYLDVDMYLEISEEIVGLEETFKRAYLFEISYIQLVKSPMPEIVQKSIRAALQFSNDELPSATLIDIRVECWKYIESRRERPDFTYEEESIVRAAICLLFEQPNNIFMLKNYIDFFFEVVDDFEDHHSDLIPLLESHFPP